MIEGIIGLNLIFTGVNIFFKCGFFDGIMDSYMCIRFETIKEGYDLFVIANINFDSFTSGKNTMLDYAALKGEGLDESMFTQDEYIETKFLIDTYINQNGGMYAIDAVFQQLKDDVS